ncbi:hypothetical protein FPV67DRAFT_1445829 [Lyophyllum atratum]|nr:hypothetical protein FPV67DRAFT_1445829 [Lyophyllum atratum]
MGCTKRHWVMWPSSGLLSLEGLKRNDRSSHPDPNGEHRYDRSYTLAATVEKGHAMGKVVPVVQIGYPYAKACIGELLEVHYLFRLVMLHMLSKFEMAISDFHSTDNNVLSFGGLLPGPNSLQMNVFLDWVWGKLTITIGEEQGKFHNDAQDDMTHLTFFVMCLRLPPGVYFKSNTLSDLI